MTGNTPAKYPKGTPRKHHFVPRGYLAGFCREGTDRLALYDRERDSFRHRQRPVDVAHIKDFYAYETAEGELNFDVERALGDIEDAALPVIKKIDAHQEITDDERHALALYVAFQYTRTPAYLATLHSFNDVLLQKLAQMSPVTDGEPMTEARIAKNFGLEMTRDVSLQMMLELAPEIATWLYGTSWLIARRPDDKTSFVTTDQPFALMPGPDYVPQPLRGYGINTPGILKTMPLSQASYLLMGDPGERVTYHTLSRDQIRDTNIAVATRCRNFVFGRELPLVERVVRKAGIEKTEWVPPVVSA